MKSAGMKKAGMKKAAAMKKGSKKANGSVMKGMKKAMKVSKIGKRWQVFNGTKEKNKSGLTKADLVKNKAGKVVSKKKSVLGKARWKSSGLAKWSDAVKKARTALKIEGFVAIGGITSQGQEFLAKA